MAKLDNVTKAKISFNESIIQLMENGRIINNDYIITLAKDKFYKFNLSENKHQSEFITHVMSKIKLKEISHYQDDDMRNKCVLFRAFINYCTSFDYLTKESYDAIMVKIFDEKLQFNQLIKLTSIAYNFAHEDDIKRVISHYASV